MNEFLTEVFDLVCDAGDAHGKEVGVTAVPRTNDKQTVLTVEGSDLRVLVVELKWAMDVRIAVSNRTDTLWAAEFVGAPAGLVSAAIATALGLD